MLLYNWLTLWGQVVGILIDWLNARLDEKSKIAKLGLDNSSLGNNPWLTGFIVVYNLQAGSWW